VKRLRQTRSSKPAPSDPLRQTRSPIPLHQACGIKRSLLAAPTMLHPLRFTEPAPPSAPCSTYHLYHALPTTLHPVRCIHHIAPTTLHQARCTKGCACTPHLEYHATRLHEIGVTKDATLRTTERATLDKRHIRFGNVRITISAALSSLHKAHKARPNRSACLTLKLGVPSVRAEKRRITLD